MFLATAAFLGAVRLVLPGAMHARLNKALGDLPSGYHGRVGDVDLAVVRGVVSLNDVELHDTQRRLVIETETLRLNVDIVALLRRELVASVDVEKPHLRVEVRRALRDAKLMHDQEIKQRAVEGKVEPVVRPLHEVLAGLMPFRLRRLELRDGSVIVSEGGFEARITAVNVLLENFTNQEGGKSARLQVAARVMEKGSLSATIRVDPSAKSPTFDAALNVRGVDLPALNPLLRWQMGVDVERGTFELISELHAQGGRFEGYVKPFVEDLKMLKPADAKQPLKVVKEAVVGVVAAVLRNKHSGKTAARVSVRGAFKDPEIGVWEAAASALHNAFLEALRPSFETVH